MKALTWFFAAVSACAAIYAVITVIETARISDEIRKTNAEVNSAKAERYFEETDKLDDQLRAACKSAEEAVSAREGVPTKICPD